MSFLRNWLDIRKGEIPVTILMFLYYYLILVTYYFLKPARDSLFLVKLGPAQLPVIFILIAVMVVPVTSLYTRAGRSLKLNQLINTTTIFLIVNLMILWWLIQLGYNWVFYLFYIWVSIYGILVTSQYWLFANAIFDPTQAKRIFVPLGVGGILGAITGGEVTNIIIKVFNVQTEDLLFFCIGFLTLCIILVNTIWTLNRKQIMDQQPSSKRVRDERQDNFSQVFGTIKGDRYLLFIVGIIAMTMMTASFVDYQFKTIASETYSTKEELTAFFGMFYGRLSLVSIIFQLLLTYRFIRILGVGGIILFLPFGLLVGSAAMMIAPGILAAVLLRGADGSFKYSIDKTGRELLFLPVPLEVKKRTKIFIDMFVDRWFRGLAGAFLLLCTAVLGLSVQQISAVVFIILVFWILVALMIRKEYVNAFRKALERREIDLNEIRMHITDAATIQTLTATLRSDNERQITYALDMLMSVKDVELTSAVLPLLQHRSAAIRKKTIEILQNQRNQEPDAAVEKHLTDDDLDVRIEALRYLYMHAEGDNSEMLRTYVQHPDHKIQEAALGCIAAYDDAGDPQLVNDSIIQTLLDREGPEGETSRFLAAKLLGRIDIPGFREYLLQLMDDTSPAIAREAIASAGRTRDREWVPLLLKKLSDRQYRKDARLALAVYGNSILGTLNDYLNDASVDTVLRSNIPRIFYKIPTQESVNVLKNNLDCRELLIKYHIVKSLNKLRDRYPDLQFGDEEIERALVSESKSYYEIIHVLHYHQSTAKTPANVLLEQALKEKLEQNLEWIFRLLGLQYPPKDIYSAFLGVTSRQKSARASAIEFLDNVLGKNIKKYLLPMLDPEAIDIAMRNGQKLFGLRIHSFNEALIHLIRGNDPWLKACAMYASGDSQSSDIVSAIEEARNDPNRVVRETVSYVLHNR